MTDVLMPALSPTMEEGTLSKWNIKAGDTVSSGDVIAEIETDKATMEVEAVDEGVVEAILVPEGTEGVKVNTPIARLRGDGEAASPPQSLRDSSPKGGASDANRSSPPGGGGREADGGGSAAAAPVAVAKPNAAEQSAGEPEKQPPETAEPKAGRRGARAGEGRDHAGRSRHPRRRAHGGDHRA